MRQCLGFHVDNVSGFRDFKLVSSWTISLFFSMLNINTFTMEVILNINIS